MSCFVALMSSSLTLKALFFLLSPLLDSLFIFFTSFCQLVPCQPFSLKIALQDIRFRNIYHRKFENGA